MLLLRSADINNVTALAAITKIATATMTSGIVIEIILMTNVLMFCTRISAIVTIRAASDSTRRISQTIHGAKS